MLVNYLTRFKFITIVLAAIVLVFVFNLCANFKPESHKKLLYEEIETKCNYGERGPRILCAVFIHQSFHKTKVQPVHNTWAKRLDLC